MLLFVDLGLETEVCAIISTLRQNKATAHIPVIAFADEGNEALQARGREAGASLVATDAAVLAHLAQLIEQALHAD